MASNTFIPVYGNYHGYYSKRPFIRDHRLALLPQGFFSGKRVLDVGCNEGWVTCEIAQSWGAHRVTGVDIDDTLIRAAWKRRRTVWSLQAPDSTLENEDNSLSQSEPPVKRTRTLLSEACLEIADYFPTSCEHVHGPLPIPHHEDQKHIFPHNISFRTADWIKCPIPEDDTPYDIIIAFSISKWIHLNSGDAGIKHFFDRAHGALKPGGAFILEPQGWDTYGKAKRLDDTLKENAKNLKLRPEDFERVLRSVGFGPVQNLGSAGEGGFNRPVDLYIKL